MSKTLRSLLFTLVLSLGMAATVQAAPDPAADAMFKKLMAASLSADYEGFTAECDATMKGALTKEKLEVVSKQLAPRFKAGYDAEYLGELKQKGYAVHLWKVRTKDGGDDFLATLSIKDGKAGGFYLH